MIALKALAAIAIVWASVGIWMVIQTRSRGWKADVAFAMFWPLHWYFEIWRNR